MCCLSLFLLPPTQSLIIPLPITFTTITSNYCTFFVPSFKSVFKFLEIKKEKIELQFARTLEHFYCQKHEKFLLSTFLRSKTNTRERQKIVLNSLIVQQRFFLGKKWNFVLVDDLRRHLTHLNDVILHKIIKWL